MPDHLADPAAPFHVLLRHHLQAGTNRIDKPSWTPEEFSNATTQRGGVRQIPLRTLNTWLAGTQIPHASNMHRLLRPLGLDSQTLSMVNDEQVRAKKQAQANALVAARDLAQRQRDRATLDHTDEFQQQKLQPRFVDDSTFVGREREMNAVIDLLTQKDVRYRKVCLVGAPNMGKSTLAALMAGNEVLRRAYPDGLLWISLGAESTLEHASHFLIEWAKSIGIHPDAENHDQTLRENVRTTLARRRRFLIIVDDVFDIEVARQMMVGGPECGLIVTCRDLRLAQELVPGNKNIVRLRHLDAEESMLLVTSFAPDIPTLNDHTVNLKLRETLEKIDGHPKMLRLLASQLRVCGNNPGRLVRAINAFDWRCESDAIKSSVRLLSQAAQSALLRLCMLKPDPESFSAALAKRIMGGAASAQQDVLDELCDSSLMQLTAYAPGHLVGFPEEDENQFYTIHRTHTELLSPSQESSDHGDVCRGAMEYFLDKLTEQEESNSDFESWLRHESGEWRDTIFSLRYYVAKSNDYEWAAFDLTRAFFTAFWWWCTFTHSGFGFCQELIQSWPQRAGVNAEIDRADLHTMLRRYPTESAPDRRQSRQDWKDVAAVLDRVLERRGLNRNVAGLNTRETELRGLIMLYRAEAYRFGEANHEQALKYYHHAQECFLKIFEAEGECWTLSWVRYHLADCMFESGNIALVAEASAICKLVIQDELAKPAGDQEILARCKILHALLALHYGESDSAVSSFHDAVYWAYRYQLYPTLDGQHEGKLDEYLVVYYQWICERVLSVLTTHVRHSPEKQHQALAIMKQLASAWKRDQKEIDLPSEQEGATAILPDQIFLPAFPAADIHNEARTKEYELHIKQTLNQVAPYDYPTFTEN